MLLLSKRLLKHFFLMYAIFFWHTAPIFKSYNISDFTVFRYLQIRAKFIIRLNYSKNNLVRQAVFFLWSLK